MPANDKHWRNLTTLHVVFAFSCLGLFAVTIWMLAADHSEEWHHYQKVTEEIKIQQARLEQQEILSNEEYQQAISEANAEIEAAQKATADHASAITELQQQIDVKALAADLKGREVRARRAERDKAKADIGIAIDRGADEERIAELRLIYEQKQRRVEELEREDQQVNTELNTLTDELNQLTAARTEAEAQRKRAQAEVDRLQGALATLEGDSTLSRIKRDIMQWPIIDGFNSPRSIVQDWLPDLSITLGMAQTARFDRCRTCHQNIDQIKAGNVPAYPHGIIEAHGEAGGEDSGHGADDAEAVSQWIAENKFPHPYATHPHPDLYLTAASPHPVQTFGCTVCHEGQGSGTDFTNAAHFPNDPHEMHQWEHDHDFATNHFWEYPMYPQRFIEASCIKCHHEVVDLANHPQFGDTAPKVVKGYRLIEKYGCFGCHEINGYDAGKPIGPDLRLEPQTAEEAEKIASDDSLIAGRMRKVGPSLRHVATKTTDSWLQYWIEEPKRFRPTTRMPQYYKLINQLDPEKLEAGEIDFGNIDLKTDLDHEFTRFAPVEIAGMADYLRSKSAPLDMLAPPAGYTPDPERGKLHFSRKGCLACHEHVDFPGSKADFGPNLSRVFAKIQPPAEGESWWGNSGEKSEEQFAEGFRWLYTWILDPQRHHARTKMPVLYVNEKATAEENPAADIAAFLLQDRPELMDGLAFDHTHAEGVSSENLHALATLYLGKATSPAQAEKAMEPGGRYPFRRSTTIKGDEIELVVPGTVQEGSTAKTLQVKLEQRQTEVLPGQQLIWASGANRGGQFTIAGVDAENGRITLEEELPRAVIPGDRFLINAEITQAMQLSYVGRRTISRYGCYGCHDIPGFEEARPIGTTLQDWGRKDPSKLALEHIEKYLHHHGEPDGSSTVERVSSAIGQAERNEFATEEAEERELSAAYFYESLLHHGRAGFLWQKLRQPRSYDYETTQSKGFDERLRMPRFPFDEEEIEAIATFVLGLVAEPPATQYLYKPEGRVADRIEGERLLHKFNCGGCHVLDLPEIKYGLTPQTAGLPLGAADFVGMTREDLVQWFTGNHRQLLETARGETPKWESIALPEQVEVVLQNAADFLDTPPRLALLSQPDESTPEKLRNAYPRLTDQERKQLQQELAEWRKSVDELTGLPAAPPPGPATGTGEKTEADQKAEALKAQIELRATAVRELILQDGVRRWMERLADLAAQDGEGKQLTDWFLQNSEVLLANRLASGEHPEAARQLLRLKPARPAEENEKFLTARSLGFWLQQFPAVEEEFKEAQAGLKSAEQALAQIEDRQSEEGQAAVEKLAEATAELQEKLAAWKRVERQLSSLEGVGISRFQLENISKKLADADIEELFLEPEEGEEPDPEIVAGRQLVEKFFDRHGAKMRPLIGQTVISFHGLLFRAADPLDPLIDQESYYDLWETISIGGRQIVPGTRFTVPALRMVDTDPGRGGEFAHWLVDDLMAADRNINRFLAWQQSPPPLYLEGIKVQTPWLYQFLKNPDRIRHTTVLRMPKFNMSDEEARSLANYFAAVTNAEYPYQDVPQQEPEYLNEMNERFHAAYPETADEGVDYLAETWQVLNAPLCIKCHSVAGRQFQSTDPKKDIQGPNLDRVAQRLQPDWALLWLYKPVWITPYTSMPANFPRGQQQFPDLFGGDASAQTVAVRDALMNYYRLMEREGRIVPEQSTSAAESTEESPSSDTPAADPKPAESPASDAPASQNNGAEPSAPEGSAKP